MNLPVFSGADSYQRIQDEASAYSHGDAVSQRHEQDREEGREGFADVPPMDIEQAFAHHGADQDQCRCGDCRH